MLTIRVRITLPFALRVTEGDYQTSPEGDLIAVEAGPMEETASATIVSAFFETDDSEDSGLIEKARFRFAGILLGRTNRLLRWYRAIRRRADIVDLTRAQASPFRFEVVGQAQRTAWSEDLRHEENGPTPVAMTIAQLTEAIKNGLASGNEPDVDVLFLLDAERALHQGRFREAVLFCWSTIDSVFNRKFDALADAATVGEWTEARKFLKGMDFGLRHKMSLGMRFAANRSLFTEPGGFWRDLSESYSKRNKIIHEGQNAVEDDARKAIEVAQRLVKIMGEIAP